jgi:hypothetical protein
LLSKKIAEHLKKDRDCEALPVWVRALEVAPGSTGGHAHLHVWWFGPFLDHAWLRQQWGKALERLGVSVPHVDWDVALQKSIDKRFSVWGRTMRGRNGRAPRTVPWPVVDVVSARDVGAGRYAQKVGVALYVAKGAKEMERLHPYHAALVYEALENARCVQWARGWAPPKVRKEGVTYSRRHATPEELAEVARRFEAVDRARLAELAQQKVASELAQAQALREYRDRPPRIQLMLTL